MSVSTPDCPKAEHFHVMAIDSSENEDFHFVFNCSTPHEALNMVLEDLPEHWEGSVEVNDHETMEPSEMPLIDYWRTPEMGEIFELRAKPKFLASNLKNDYTE